MASDTVLEDTIMRCWSALQIETYEQAGGKTIWELIAAQKAALEATEKRVAELEASEKALLEAHARRGARVAELEAENQKLAGALIEILKRSDTTWILSAAEDALEGTRWQSNLTS